MIPTSSGPAYLITRTLRGSAFYLAFFFFLLPVASHCSSSWYIFPWCITCSFITKFLTAVLQFHLSTIHYFPRRIILLHHDISWMGERNKQGLWGCMALELATRHCAASSIIWVCPWRSATWRIEWIRRLRASGMRFCFFARENHFGRIGLGGIGKGRDRWCVGCSSGSLQVCTISKFSGSNLELICTSFFFSPCSRS